MATNPSIESTKYDVRKEKPRRSLLAYEEKDTIEIGDKTYEEGDETLTGQTFF